MKTNGLLQILAVALGCFTIHAQVTTEAWVQRFTGSGVGAADKGKAMVTDQAGNLIIAGETDDPASELDWLIIKYDAAGGLLWTNRYNSATSRDDFVAGVAVSTNGTIFVTGSSDGTSIIKDFVTIAYSATGVPLWTNRYDGPANSHDLATAVAVSANGTVLVTGLSDGIGTANDWATIAYTETGVPLWTNRYSGPDNNTDCARALTVNSSGTVFVTGFSYSLASHADCLTIAYTEAGVPLWTNRYNGPSNGDDLGSAVAVGSNGTVFVTGEATGTGSASDFLTLAYSEAGVPLWTNRYNGPANSYDEAVALAMGADDSVVVTGSYQNSSGNLDFATLAYSSTGIPLWTNRYAGPTNNSDTPTAVKVGPSGNVYVTGGSVGVGTAGDYAVLAYSSAGVPLWTNRYTGPGGYDDQPAATAVRSDDTVFVTGVSRFSNNQFGYDCLTLAFTGAGVPLWTNRYDGPANGNDMANAVAVGSDGTVYVTGQSLNATNLYEYATIAYSNAGAPLWTNRFVGVPTQIAVRSDGSVVVGGSSGGKYLTIAYTCGGIPLWTNLYTGRGTGVSGMAVSPDGSVFLTGYSGAKVTPYDTIGISSSGSLMWSNIIGIGYISRSCAVSVGANGNVFVTGYGMTFNPNGWDYFTVGYSSSGALLWYQQYRGPATNSYNYNYATAMATDTNGNLFVTGGSMGLNAYDYATIAYTGAGVPLWTNRYNGPGNSNDTASAIGVTPSGNVIVTGTSLNPSYRNDYATIAYSGAGVPLWTNRYSVPGSNNTAVALAIASDGTIYVSGNSSGSEFGDYATVAYSEAGLPLSTNRYNGPANRNEYIPSKYCLATAPDGFVVVGGTEVAHGISDYAVVKYVTTSGGSLSSPNDPNNLPPAVINRIPSGDAQLTFYGTSGASYILEHTFDLGSNSWTPLQTNTAALDGSIAFTSPPSGPINFWRIRPLP